jgi:acyl-coenzyme A synthetase/AMP-(fatty) acid ligase
LADLVERLSATEFNLLGRPADMVKLGGRRASLAGLNAILVSVPGVTDGVFVAPEDLNQRPGARLLAFVIAPQTDPEKILAELRGRIEPVFLPRRVIPVRALPRNDAGKLPRAALLDLLDQSIEVQ